MSCSYRKYYVTFQKVLLSIFGYSLNPPPPPPPPPTYNATYIYYCHYNSRVSLHEAPTKNRLSIKHGAVCADTIGKEAARHARDDRHEGDRGLLARVHKQCGQLPLPGVAEPQQHAPQQCPEGKTNRYTCSCMHMSCMSQV